MNDNFEKFKTQLNNKLPEVPLQQVKPLVEKSEQEKAKRYSGTRQMNVDLDEELFLSLKNKAYRERKPVRELVQEAITYFLRMTDQSHH